jgi:hypothetical protein
VSKTSPNDLESCSNIEVRGCYLVRFSCSPTFYRLDLHNKLCVALANICKNQIENQISLDFVMVTGSVCLLNASLDTQVLPIVFTIECRVVMNV